MIKFDETKDGMVEAAIFREDVNKLEELRFPFKITEVIATANVENVYVVKLHPESINTFLDTLMLVD